MADYYPVLARAVSRLSENNARTRNELYERARGIVLEELRKRDPEKLAPEQAALEAAVLRLEAEAAAQQAPVRAAACSAASSGARRAGSFASAAKPPPGEHRRAGQDRFALSFSGFSGPDGQASRAKRLPEKPAPAPARSAQRAASDKRMPDPGEALGGALNSLTVMLYGTAFLVAVMAVTGVVYVRGLIWVAEGVVTYPVLLVVTATVFSLLIILPRAMFHSASTWTTFNFLSRLLYSASRRVF